jgi:hypothetical protein
MHKILAILAFAALAVPMSQAQTAAATSTPDLSGSWKINIAKSDFGQAPPPTTQTEVITQSGNTITFAIARESQFGKQNYTFSVKADGTETPFPSDALPADSPFKILSSSAAWQGPSLVVTQKTSFQDNPGSTKATYTLSPDGKQLTKDTQITFSQGEFETKAVYDKQ